MKNKLLKQKRKTIHDIELKNIYPEIHNPNCQRRIEIQLFNAFATNNKSGIKQKNYNNF